jgi:hypothetical protein
MCSSFILQNHAFTHELNTNFQNTWGAKLHLEKFVTSIDVKVHKVK